MRSLAETRRSNRRQKAESLTATEAAGDAIRAAIDRISPRKRPPEEAGLLSVVPDDDDLLSQRGGAAEVELSVPRVDVGAVGGVLDAGRSAVWVEDAATGNFFRATDRVAAHGDDGARRTVMGTLGLTTRGGDSAGNVRLVALAARCQAVLSAILTVGEGILAGLALLHALVVEQCAQRPFLVVTYIPAALRVQQAFQLLTTLAMVSSLLAHHRATRQAAAASSAKKNRDASYQQAAAGVVSLLYGLALVVSLLNVETVWRWSLINPQAVIRMDDASRARLYAEQFDSSYPLWRGLASARLPRHPEPQ